MNFFAPYTAADRYSKGRPDFHDNTIVHIKNFLSIHEMLDKALDVACGTGLSTQALLNISTNVYATDSSSSMLLFALQKEKIKYQLAKAEEQPFENNFFDLITVCSGVHWFDIDKFLMEANRVLKSEAWLILYDNFFLAEMEGNSKFNVWYKTTYLKSFPAPTRSDNYNWTNENLDKMNFTLLNEEKYNNGVNLNVNELTLYFTTQSNIISVVENKEMTYEAVENWLKTELSPFFPNPNNQAIFYFGNWIKYLQKK